MVNPVFPNPHDRFFKHTFGRVKLARGFLAEHLPADVVDSLRLDSLERTEDTLIDCFTT